MNSKYENLPPPPTAGRTDRHHPLIIPRPKHRISRKNIDKDALKVLYRLHRSGFLAYMVGGGVRDLLLGWKPKDYDLATDARPSQVRRLFRNSRIIGRRFRLIQVFFAGNKTIEVSTFRRRSEYTTEEPGLVRNENTFGTPAEDAFRRDLTINGLFYDISNFSIIDYVRGVDDLQKRIIRAIGDPDVRFVEDPVRMFRTVRHAARTGFEIEPESYKAVQQHCDKIWNCPVSRVRDEFMRELREGSARPSISLLTKTGLLFSLFPELEPVLGKGGERADQLRDRMFAILEALDQRIKQGARIPDPLLLATFFFPYVLGLEINDRAPRGQGRTSFVQGEHRLAVRSISERIQFPKRHLDTASQILSAQDALRRAAARGNVPKSLRRKSYYPFSLYFFGLEADSRAAAVPAMFLADLAALQPEISPAPKRRRSRRRRTGRRPRPAAPPERS